jgi:myo-inositol-1(or 4)-monophosphatase
MTDDLAQLQTTARQAALAAGQVIAERMNQPRVVYEKAPKDVVTATDHAAQQAALEVITTRFPQHKILAEEDPSIQPDKYGTWTMPKGYTWIVDPVDGTSNFASGMPIFCTSVGLARDGEPLVGVIYDPTREELFMAAKGQGATLNGEALPILMAHSLYESLLCVDWAQAPRLDYSIRDVLFTLAPRVRTTRVIGSAALAMTYVAAGRLQLYANVGLKPWDAAAAALIAQEAGAQASLPTGGEWQLGSPTIIIGHPDPLNEAVDLFSRAREG